MMKLTIIASYSYLDDIYHIGLNLEAPSGHLPELPSHNELPPRPPSPALTDELESENSDSNNDEDVAQLLQDWSIRLNTNKLLPVTIFYIMCNQHNA